MKFLVTKYFSGLDESADIEIPNRNTLRKQYVFIKFTPEIIRTIRKHEPKVTGDEEVAFISIHFYGAYFLDEDAVDYSSDEDVKQFNKLISIISEYDESELEDGIIISSNTDIDEAVLDCFSLDDSTFLNITQDNVVFFSDSVHKRSYYIEKNKFKKLRSS